MSALSAAACCSVCDCGCCGCCCCCGPPAASSMPALRKMACRGAADSAGQARVRVWAQAAVRVASATVK